MKGRVEQIHNKIMTEAQSQSRGSQADKEEQEAAPIVEQRTTNI